MPNITTNHAITYTNEQHDEKWPFLPLLKAILVLEHVGLESSFVIGPLFFPLLRVRSRSITLKQLYRGGEMGKHARAKRKELEGEGVIF